MKKLRVNKDQRHFRALLKSGTLYIGEVA